jgi:hypothetical protein
MINLNIRKKLVGKIKIPLPSSTLNQRERLDIEIELERITPKDEMNFELTSLADTFFLSDSKLHTNQFTKQAICLRH